MNRFNDLTDQQFGQLTVIRRGENDKRGKAHWLCECVCGNRTLVAGSKLRNHHTQSCGCLNKEITVQRSTTHGMTHSFEYQSYKQAKGRCENPNNPSYSDYGGRGIQFRYTRFEEFLEDLGICPPGKTLDRFPDNDGHYEKGNCRWATPEEQNNNKRTNVLITAFGRTQTAIQWSRETGINEATIRQRFRVGWPSEHLFDPPGSRQTLTEFL